MINKKIIFSTLFCSIMFLAKAAHVPMLYQNATYEPDIKTVIMSVKGTYERFPVLKLNDMTTQLLLEFDEIKSENDNYQYTIIHCTHDWMPSQIIRQNDYIQGNFFENINDYSFSNSTFKTYTHYRVEFPTEYMMPKFSGNYILKVYRNFDEEDIVLTQRFVVVENKFIVNTDVKIATLSQHRATKHEVDFTVNIGNYQLPNPMMDLKTVIVQNARWDNAIFNLKPRFINGKIMDYNYEDVNLFDAGNEFRYFDIRSLRFLSFNVRRKYMEGNFKHVILYNDNTRCNLTYIQTIDFNGKRVIDNRDGGVKGEIESDYCMTHFTFNSSKLEKDVYIFGELTNWQILEEFKLTWNEKFQSYEGEVLLKQAYYDYYYVTKDSNDPTKAELIHTEGNYNNTENDYYVLTYARNQNLSYDELLGISFANSMKTKRN